MYMCVSHQNLCIMHEGSRVQDIRVGFAFHVSFFITSIALYVPLFRLTSLIYLYTPPLYYNLHLLILQQILQYFCIAPTELAH